jgi:hypothetical protein
MNKQSESHLQGRPQDAIPAIPIFPLSPFSFSHRQNASHAQPSFWKSSDALPNNQSQPIPTVEAPNWKIEPVWTNNRVSKSLQPGSVQFRHSPSPLAAPAILLSCRPFANPWKFSPKKADP